MRLACLVLVSCVAAVVLPGCLDQEGSPDSPVVGSDVSFGGGSGGAGATGGAGGAAGSSLAGSGGLADAGGAGMSGGYGFGGSSPGGQAGAGAGGPGGAGGAAGAGGAGGSDAGASGQAGSAGSAVSGQAGAGGSGQAGSGGQSQGGQSAAGKGGSLPGGAGGGETGGSSDAGGSGNTAAGSGAGASGPGGGGEAGAGGDTGAGGTSGACENDDCDLDGWSPAQGDCCDEATGCADPARVNPGAYEVPGNGVDDDCDGVIDVATVCDQDLPSALSSAVAAAQAMGVCRVVPEVASSPAEKRWGLLSAALVRADGSPLQDSRAASVRASFGALAGGAIEGQRFVVLSTGIASDGSQDKPGPNGGAPKGTNVSTSHQPSSEVNIGVPGSPGSIVDWFTGARPPLKPASSLPLLPGCPGKSSDLASDSVMLALRVRAPTNARSLSFRTRFVSAEYPEFVCTSYSDQFVALIDSGAPENPADKNLLVYTDDQGMAWPVSLNLALTPLFSVCDPASAGPTCTKDKVHPEACALGPAGLAGTGFEAPAGQPKACSIGGATGWLTVVGNVVPGEPVDLRFALWDVGDSLFDSVALLDALRWSPDPVVAGTSP